MSSRLAAGQGAPLQPVRLDPSLLFRRDVATFSLILNSVDGGKETIAPGPAEETVDDDLSGRYPPAFTSGPMPVPGMIVTLLGGDRIMERKWILPIDTDSVLSIRILPGCGRILHCQVVQ